MIKDGASHLQGGEDGFFPMAALDQAGSGSVFKTSPPRGSGTVHPAVPMNCYSRRFLGQKTGGKEEEHLTGETARHTLRLEIWHQQPKL